ncbi:MAG: L-aspartate oxidase, partial [Rhodospirillales bacterium]
KAFAGQTFDRTVHKGDLTGIEIINRLAEQVWARDIGRLEDHRAVELIKTPSGDAIAGVLMIDMRAGDFVFVQARAVLLATGGGPTMYKYHTPSGDKSCDGMAMALRAGLPLREMEMIQFHPTGLMAGPETRMTGTVLEEGLRGFGGHLLDGAERRFMPDYDGRAERATRDIVSRAMYAEMRAGNTAPEGGLYLTMRHLDADAVKAGFKGMVERCADCGFDLVGGLVEVVPTAHYMMGGVVFGVDCSTGIAGLFAAGEDTGGVHGANRLGGNGVANATVFGAIAGDSMAASVAGADGFADPDEDAIAAGVERCRTPLGRPTGDLDEIRERLFELMWEDVGIVRSASGLDRAGAALVALEADLDAVGVAGEDLVYNLTWHDWLNLKSLILVGRAITAAAMGRQDSRGAHFNSDHPETGDLAASRFTSVRLDGGAMVVDTEPVRFTRVEPGETLLADSAAE